MNSTEIPTKNKPEFKDNLDEIIWSIYNDLDTLESSTITMESLIQEKLQNSLKRYQEELERNYNYVLERNEYNNATVLKIMDRFSKDKEQGTIYEDSET